MLAAHNVAVVCTLTYRLPLPPVLTAQHCMPAACMLQNRLTPHVRLTFGLSASQHMLPNFKECWWDSWILDVLLCNAAGRYPLLPAAVCTDTDSRPL